MSPEQISRQYIIPHDHPCLAGHFPGDPIVPGAVLLDYIRALFQQWMPENRITAIAQAKFHKPLRPEQEFTITISRKNEVSFNFECKYEDEKIASGLFSTANRS